MTMKKVITISVLELVDHICRQGDLPSTTITSRPTPAAGIKAHQLLQSRRDQASDAEVDVSLQAEGETVILDIHGRIDIVSLQGQTVIIEEIKTTKGNLKDFIAANQDLHWSQAMAYAAMYVLSNGLDDLVVQLTYFQTETRTVKSFPRKFSSENLRCFFEDLTTRYLNWREKNEQWGRDRDRSILTSDFPYSSFRPGQTEMIRTVYETIKEGKKLLIQAPTGIGKTVAVLFPALKAVAEGHTEKIFYLTSRTTGRVIAEETLAAMKKKGLRIRSLSLTAKEKLCLNPDIYCLAEDCDYARGYYDRLQEVWPHLLESDTFTPETIIAIAREHRLCPFELSLDFALWMDCIICDFNYAFDPRVSLKRFFDKPGGAYTFLVDEAHNLVDRARSMFSASIHRSFIEKLQKCIGDPASALSESAQSLVSALEDYRKKLDEGETGPWDPSPPEDLVGPVRMFCDELETWLMRSRRHPDRRFLTEIFFDALWFLKVAERYDESYTTCLEKNRREFKVNLFCTDPSPQLSKALEKAVSSVHFSATLTPLPYFSRILGCGEEAETCSLPSPFPAENLCLLICDSVSTLFRKREFTRGDLSRLIGSFTREKTGNYLVFFPSYDYMEMIYPMYAAANPHHQTMIQTRHMAEGKRVEFLGHFTRENSRILVGFVVMGGIFGEGIDLEGDRLSGAVIVGVGLPQISVEREVIHAHFSDRDEPGFQYAYLYPGITRVFQAAGRVIRSENDRGAVLLVDPRYTRPQYTTLFPDSWEVRQVQTEVQTREALDIFWNGNRYSH